MLPARAGSTFLKSNSEQSAFKNALSGTLKALDKHYIGHFFGTYRSFARSVRLSSASIAHHNFDSRSWLVHLSSDPQNDNTYHTCSCVNFWWLVPFAVCFSWLYTLSFAKMLSRFTFFRIFTKNMLPARAGSTFLKTNSEQSAFKPWLLEHWRPGIRIHGAILWTFIALLPVRFVSFPLRSPITILIFACDLCIFNL